MHNQVITISNGSGVEIFRIILDLAIYNQTILVRIETPSEYKSKKRGRPKTKQSKIDIKPVRLFTELLWENREDLYSLHSKKLLQTVEIEPDAIFLKPIINDKQQKLFANRLSAMRGFLDLDNLKHRLILDHSLGGLVKEGAEASGFSKTQIYKLFSLLCRYGFTESSLRPRFDRCGLPGNTRPCDPGGRKKPGARTVSEKIELATTGKSTQRQPGISTLWKNMILAADIGIKNPKPVMPKRVKIIINSAFLKKFQDINGKLIPIHPALGEYPNSRQIQRVLMTNTSTIEKLIHKTTKFHFVANKRGLTGKNWQGVSGPGHTWAIDSTIGDIYLRSLVNRNWIVGRPIVYILVDVWSTAVVGFYVCLNGPSWNMAKIALFCALAGPNLIAEMYGYVPIMTLDPEPTISAVLMCDRGEYLSKGASYTGAKLIQTMSYTPPYRGDLKGLVEVLHRIEKDQQFSFVPGAIDARRKEYELRKFDRMESQLTVREYTQYLYSVFSEYNLTANRDHRLDSHMRATDVLPTPAGLWYWGHNVGIGFQKLLTQSELITSLLPTADVSVTRSGILLGGKQYLSNSAMESEFTTLARNNGGWGIKGHYFPGSVSKIWIPNPDKKGMLEMKLSDHSTASAELSFDEFNDALAYSKLKKQKQEHEKSVSGIEFNIKREDIVQQAKKLTAEALNQPSSPQPPIKETRALEHEISTSQSLHKPFVSKFPQQTTIDEVIDFNKIMKDILDEHNSVSDSNE